MTQFGCFARGNHSSAWRTGRGGHTTLLQYPVTGCSTVVVVYHTRWKYVDTDVHHCITYHIVQMLLHDTSCGGYWRVTVKCAVLLVVCTCTLCTMLRVGTSHKSVCTLTSPWRHLSSFKFLTYSTSRQLFCKKLKRGHQRKYVKYF